jgi:hypothetical protein
MLPVRIIFSIRTQKYFYCIRMTVTSSHEGVVAPDWYGVVDCGSSLIAVKAGFILSHPSPSFTALIKDFHFFLHFFTACFLLVKNTYKYPYSLKAVKSSNGIVL